MIGENIDCVWNYEHKSSRFYNWAKNSLNHNRIFLNNQRLKQVIVVVDEELIFANHTEYVTKIDMLKKKRKKWFYLMQSVY